jgi:DNA-binding SARP family transcriptional activator
MDIELLGPLTVRQGGVSLTPTPAKLRTLVAVLALNAEQTVSVSSLREELWGEDVPRCAHATLQTYILHLRRLVKAALDEEPGADPADVKRIVATCPGGYQLNLMGGRMDVGEFDRHAADGYRAHALGDFTAASKHFAQALALWRGPALVDVQVGDVLGPQVHRLEEARLNVLERRIDAELRLGHHHELLGELAGLVDRHRTHEGLHAHYMVALYRSGRQCEAVAAYRHLRSHLVNQLGMEPVPSLQRLHHAILASDSRINSDGGQLALALPANSFP